MEICKVVELLKKNNLLVEVNTENKVFNYLSYNSKDVESDTLFICKGLNFELEYLEEAINKGVICYISESVLKKDFPYIIVKDVRKSMAIISKAFYDVSDKKLFLIGVTGTKGKTTTVNFIKNIFEEKENRKEPYMSTIDYFTGKRYGESHNTTSESVDIYRCIKDAKESNYNYLTLEISSQSVKLDRIYGMKFDIGVLTNIDLDHISTLEHSSFEEYLECKIEFLKKCKTVILYRDTKYYDKIVSMLHGKNIITYGFSDASYIVKDIKKDKDSTIFSCYNNGKSFTYKINMIGEFNVLNACVSLIISDIYNIDYETRLKGLLKTKVLGRMNIFKGKTTLVVDYAHNELSLLNLLDAIRKNYKNKNIKLVFGCPGDKAFNRREEMGLLANKYAKYVYITTEDPGSVSALDISRIISSYLTIPYKIVLDRENAIKEAYLNSNKNDIVLVLGKGDEKYQLVNNEYIYYKSDVTVAEELTNSIKISN